MKKILLGVLIGIGAAIPAATFAYGKALPWTNVIYQVGEPESRFDDTVSVMDDGDNKCYVLMRGFESQAISCVKR